LSIDIDPNRAMKKENITKLTFKDNAFDIIFSSHVLEHVENDIKAMQEFYRVLKPNGFAILQVPINKKYNSTYEDKAVLENLERNKIFGHPEHVRIYGNDYNKRLIRAGFKVTIDNYINKLDKEMLKKYVLSNEDIYYCQKETYKVVSKCI